MHRPRIPPPTTTTSEPSSPALVIPYLAARPRRARVVDYRSPNVVKPPRRTRSLWRNVPERREGSSCEAAPEVLFASSAGFARATEPWGGFGGGRRGPLRGNVADGPFSALWARSGFGGLLLRLDSRSRAAGTGY